MFKRNITILLIVSIYCYLSFLIKFYPEYNLILLLIFAITISYLTILREKKLFFISLNFKIISISIFLSFIPFITLYLIPRIIPSFYLFEGYKTAILVIVFPTCIAYTLVQNKLITLSKNFFLSISIIFYSTLFFLLISLLNLAFEKRIFITSVFLIFCYLSHLSLNAIESQKKSRIKKSFDTLNNEKIEILNQVTYSNFLNGVSNLISERLEDITSSSTILILMESNKSQLVLCQTGKNILKTVKKQLPMLEKKNQTIELESGIFECIPVEISDETTWVFFESVNDQVNLSKVEDIITEYGIILDTVRLLYSTHQKYVETSLNTNQLLQVKLFNSIETEKKKYTNYLHDHILQSVIGLHTLVSNLEGSTEIIELINIEFSKLVRSIRTEIFNTSPSTLYYLPLEENIQILIDDFNRKYSETEFILKHNIKATVPKYVIAPVYRIIKELNENIGKHASATIGKTNISVKNSALSIIIEDNGIGIKDYLQIEKILIQTKEHVGLLSIKNDINWLNGSFELLSVPTITVGTMIKITIPFNEEATNENPAS
ncbi:sensor histidine kinase [Lysinibacillus xylanilyticus]|uniref:sensor histidine kinase n=1 Tax=Lysinibacillus xylanilyticus TaxID=582475 RepID=UPI003811A092